MVMRDNKMKSQKTIAGAIKACLDQLAEEAKQANLTELCQLIRVSALAAEDVIGPQANIRTGKIQRRPRRNSAGADKAEAST